MRVANVPPPCVCLCLCHLPPTTNNNQQTKTKAFQLKAAIWRHGRHAVALLQQRHAASASQHVDGPPACRGAVQQGQGGGEAAAAGGH